MTNPSQPSRRIPGWLYAVLFVSILAAFIVLVETGHTDQTAQLLALGAPILGGLFVADRTTAVSRHEGEATRADIRNGGTTAGLLNALDHPDVQAKITALSQPTEPPAKGDT